MKLTFGSAAVATVILLVTYSTLSSSTREVASKQAEEHAAELLSYFSGMMAEAVAANDRIQIHLLARALLNNGVHALAVVDGDGKIQYSSLPESGPDSPKDPFPISPNLKPYAWGMLGTVIVKGKTFLHATTDMRFDSTKVGRMHLWFNRTDLEASLQGAHAFVYPIVAVGFLLMICFSVVVLQIPFRALKNLTIEAKHIGAGDLSRRVPVNGHDEVAAFCEAFNSMVDGLCQARSENLRRHLETIQAMISTVEAKDAYTQGHCVRVQNYARKILDLFAPLSPGERENIEIAALLHDIGKIGIPDEVLLKENRLTVKEMEIIRTHVLIGEKILLHLDSMKEIAGWVRHHHERWDGLGYPDGLRGKAIPFASRVIGVADAIDAMRTDRPYRKALTLPKAIQALEEGKEKQFDPEVVDHAISFLADKEKKTESAYA